MENNNVVNFDKNRKINKGPTRHARLDDDFDGPVVIVMCGHEETRDILSSLGFTSNGFLDIG